MIIERTIYINKIQPEPLSFAVPAGLEAKVDVNFLDQSGEPHGSDLLAQLQLTARSSVISTNYPMPATDVVNGKARAVIPAGAITDMNGYRLRLFGTLGGEPWLLATGVVSPIAGAGPEAVPPQVITQVPIVLTRGQVGLIDVRLWDDLGSDPFDLATATISAAIYTQQGGSMLTPFAVAQTAANAVQLSLTIDQVNALPDGGYWNLQLGQAAGVTTLAEGPVTLVGTP